VAGGEAGERRRNVVATREVGKRWVEHPANHSGGGGVVPKSASCQSRMRRTVVATREETHGMRHAPPPQRLRICLTATRWRATCWANPIVQRVLPLGCMV